jgi:predicted transcriptional regulator
MVQPRVPQPKEFRDLRRAVAANDIVRALAGVGFTQKQIASATGATDRSVRNWAATGAIRPTYDERIRELSEISLLLSETMTARGVTQWLSARNRQLGGEKPVDLIARGDGDRVREAAESFVAGAYV